MFRYKLAIKHCEQTTCFKIPILFGFCFALISCSGQDPDILAGEEVFTKTCKACHASGINGAPIVGNKKMWSERANQGLETLVVHASSGYELMPAKGGNTSLSEEQITQAVKYFLWRLEEE